MKILLTGILIFVSTIAMAATPHLEGVYQCKGYDAFINKDYTGTIIFKKSGDVYDVVMDFDKNEKFKGTGLVHKGGKAISIIAKDFDDKKLAGYSITYFNISAKGTLLDGAWTNLGSTKAIDEVCERKR